MSAKISEDEMCSDAIRASVMVQEIMNSNPLGFAISLPWIIASWLEESHLTLRELNVAVQASQHEMLDYRDAKEVEITPAPVRKN